MHMLPTYYVHIPYVPTYYIHDYLITRCLRTYIPTYPLAF
jgi:hypothetical protein